MSDAGAEGPGLEGHAVVTRYIDHEHDVVVARGDFTHLYRAYVAHAERWESGPDGLSEVMMRQGLGALALYLCNRPVDEVSAWTLNIRKPLMNLFFAGDAAEHAVVGRVFLDNVKQTESSQLFVEIQRRGRTPYRSAIEVDGLDVLGIFEQYFARSEQLDTKFYEVTDTEFVMFQALPDVDSSWLSGITRDSALSALNGSLRKLDTQVFNFRCGCDVKRMTELVKGMYSERPDELFQGDDRVEVVCPRCGHKWWLKRNEF